MVKGQTKVSKTHMAKVLDKEAVGMVNLDNLVMVNQGMVSQVVMKTLT